MCLLTFFRPVFYYVFVNCAKNVRIGSFVSRKILNFL